MRLMTRVLLRLYLSNDRPLGPGKVQVLEWIRDGGSISEAARDMKMSYRSAWLPVHSMNSLFRSQSSRPHSEAAAADRRR
jgi:molybdate transport system regulatory protein